VRVGSHQWDVLLAAAGSADAIDPFCRALLG
jgi:hypothetical protein